MSALADRLRASLIASGKRLLVPFRSPWNWAWLLLAIPGLCQLGLLCSAIFGRILYPFDLEWMEGGMLAHVWQLSDGDGIYNEPSVDFIPFLYTPLYPAVLAVLEPIFGISYQVARTVSVLSIVAIVVFTYRSLVGQAEPAQRPAARVGTAVAGGVMAATYPWVEGWFDIARADSLFLAMVIGGLLALSSWARTGHGWAGHARVGAAAAVLALSFFCKQTGVLYVAAGGFILLVMNWRRLPVYVGVAGLIGLGGTWVMNRVTGGWFWTYIYEVHQAHDTNMDRFYKSFDHILWKFPVVTVVIASALLVTLATWAVTQKRPPSSKPLFVWSWVFAVSCLVGALGWATQWAHFNAYIPAMVTGGIAAGAALPALAGCWASFTESGPAGLRGMPAWPGQVLAMLVAATLGWQLQDAWWKPAPFVPKVRDVRAGHRLIEIIRDIDGDVFMPFHPWYPKLAGKRVYTHRMGVMDVSYVHHGKHRGRKPGQPPPWQVRGLEEAFADNQFAAIIWDNRPVDHYFRTLKLHYRVDDVVKRLARPRLFTGAKVVPRDIWVANTPVAPPPGARALWNFEDGTLDGFTIEGVAWGKRATSRSLPGQSVVRQFLGKYYASSMHKSDRSTGTMTSPAFVIDGRRLTFRLSGGRRPDDLRVELRVDGIAEPVFTATGRNSERMHIEDWDVSAYRGKTARLVFIDDAPRGWGHLNVDEIWMWE